MTPDRKGWTWLQAQRVAEAQRRGLPLRMASGDAPVPKATAEIDAQTHRDADAVLALLQKSRVA